jgi:prophage tail gpP-like protein
MIELEVNGKTYTKFTDATITLAINSMANDFSFTASAVDGFPPFKDGDVVKCIVDGELKLTGYIDGVNGNESNGSHLVTYSGRDRTQDFIDSSINTINDIKATGTLTLKSLIEKVVDHLGQDLKVVDLVEPDKFNTAEDIVSPKVGANALDFVSTYAAKRQCLLSSNGDGDIVITQSSATDSGEVLRSVEGGDNNIISQNWSRASRERYNRYVSRGQLDPVALGFASAPDIAAVQGQGGGVTDDEVRSGRQNVKVETAGYSNEQLADRSKWSKQLARSRGSEFGCVIRGHSKESGGVWDVNELALVESLAADISQSMLINVVTFSESEGQPTVTTLELVEKNVYTINEKLLSQKTVGKQQNVYWK